MEQCSSEVAAAYKASLVADKLADASCRGTFVDLTGGYGVDFSALAPWFQRSIYVENQPALCEIARHNFPLLGLSRAEIHNADGQTILEGMAEVDLCYVDPARRDGQGRKVMLVEDCVPNVARMLPAMIGHARHVLVKLSPMLDITRALRSFPVMPVEVHVVAVAGECKELLLWFDRGRQDGKEPLMVCRDDHWTFRYYPSEEAELTIGYANVPDLYLYEPGSALLKAGAFKVIAQRWGLRKLHPNTHLYTSSRLVPDFPGRSFCVKTCTGFGKRELKPLLAATAQANLTVRNFPGTVADLRKRFKLKDGGKDYWFATTLADNRHVIIVTEKA